MSLLWQPNQEHKPYDIPICVRQLLAFPIEQGSQPTEKGMESEVG